MIEYKLLISINISLFLIAIWGIFSSPHLIQILIGLEILVLSASLNFIIFSIYYNDILGQVFALLILTVAGAESAIGLAIFLTYYRLRGDIVTSFINTLKS